MADSWIGRRAPKPDAPARVTGRIVYGHDLRLPGMLEGKVLRSPYPSARIAHLDVSRAARLPGVWAVLTGRDIPAGRIGLGRDNPVLKTDRVRQVGDEVAAVVASDADTALAALALIDIAYEPLPGLFDPAAALQPEAPLIHPEKGSNLLARRHYQHGDPLTALDEADVVVEDQFHLPPVAPAPMEPAVVVAEWTARGTLTVHTTNQAPFLMQYELGRALELDPGRIRIVQTAIGGAFGRGLEVYPFEALAALLARACDRPVRIAFDRQEEFLATPLRQPVQMTMRSGAMQDGRLWVRHAHARLDIGAYASLGTVTPVVMAEIIGSLYRVPHAGFTVELVHTNNPFTGAMRGFGGPQATFVVETQMDRLAEALGRDPLAFRRQNANRPDETTPGGLKITTCGLRECLDRVGELRDERLTDPTPPRRRGVGFAATMNVGGGARMHPSDGCGAVVKVDDFGRVTLLTGAGDIGQGTDAVLSQIVAETLGVTLDAVTCVSGDTALTPWDAGVHASRTTFVAGKAAQLAAAEAHQQILASAAELMEVDPSDLVVTNGRVFVRGVPESGLTLDKVVRARHFQAGGALVMGYGWYDPPNEPVGEDMKGNLSATYSFGAQAAEVEVDSETGVVRVLRLWTANDIGRAINPMLVEGQLEGGIHMGLGYALSEEAIVDQGQVVNGSLRECGLLTASDMPAIRISLIETLDPEGPFGAKGVGEIGVAPVAPAVVNAIFDAVGVRLTSLPVRPEALVARSGSARP